MDDKEAIRCLKAGDIRGLEILVVRYQVKAIRAAYFITHDDGSRLYRWWTTRKRAGWHAFRLIRPSSGRNSARESDSIPSNPLLPLNAIQITAKGN
jgi:hypothetical protein